MKHNKLFHRMLNWTCQLLLIMGVTACTYETVEETNNAGSNGEDMSRAKTATATVISKTAQVGPIIQDAFQLPTVYTVQFSISGKRPYPGPGADGNINPVAEIGWSLGGNTIYRKVSAFSGASITGLCENVVVKVSDETSPLDFSQQQAYEVTILAAPGTRPGNINPPTYQTYQNSTSGVIVRLGASLLAAASFVDVPVPQNIGVVSVLSTALVLNGNVSLSTGDVVITQFNTSTGQLKQYYAGLPIFVPIGSQVSLLRITNNLLADIVLVSLTWGIDG